MILQIGVPHHVVLAALGNQFRSSFANVRRSLSWRQPQNPATQGTRLSLPLRIVRLLKILDILLKIGI
jgi:hypothetical protein